MGTETDRMRRVAIATVGCKLNQAESQSLIRQLGGTGYRVVTPDRAADVYIINTCTVTGTADAKCRHIVRQLRRAHPRARIVVTGCYAQRAPHELAAIDGVDLVVDNRDKPGLLRLLEDSGRIARTEAREGGPPGLAAGFRTRAFIKIQDGCGNFCTYCIVPFVRGEEKSVPLDVVVNDIRQAAADGYREAVLTGTEIGVYRSGNAQLRDLITALLQQTDISRLRLSSLQPNEIIPELASLWRDRRLCRHFHISLQSGADAVLRRMNRKYHTQDFRDAVSLLRREIPDVAVTTDVIVGFPGETASEFRETLDFCREMGFARIHVFPYSPRDGTAAARMSGQVGEPEKASRSRAMLALAAESAALFRRQFVGRTVEVLWEQRLDGGAWSGLTDNYLRIYAPSETDMAGSITGARLTSLTKYGLSGEVCP